MHSPGTWICFICVGDLNHEANAVLDAVQALLLDGNANLSVLDHGDRTVVAQVDAHVVSAHFISASSLTPTRSIAIQKGRLDRKGRLKRGPDQEDDGFQSFQEHNTAYATCCKRPGRNLNIRMAPYRHLIPPICI